MSDPTPNPDQRALIESTEGLYRVDAGAGTGKTFAVTRRYARIVEQDGVAPEDALLVTFTRNAAEEMRTRIVEHCEYGVADLDDAPIGTFHSLCLDVLREHGHDAPRHLGLDGRITGSTRVVEDELVEGALFREFLDRFTDDHPEHADRLRVVDDPDELRSLIAELAAKGVFPTAEGWYRDGERALVGDRDAFRALFDERNAPRNGGSRQSRLRSALADYGDGRYHPDAPSTATVRGDGKRVPEEVADLAFEQDREGLFAFVHDLYHEYLSFALARDYLTFGLLQGLAYVLLCEDHAVRGSVAFEYVTVDEFQDSSEIQFRLALLLADAPNLCVVGDWRQSIYGFQYADVDNVREFEARLDRFRRELNRDADRIGWTAGDVESVSLRRNYRSTASILELSTAALSAPATARDDPDPVTAEPLVPDTDRDDSVVEAIRHEDEHEAVLTKIQSIVGSEEYLVADDDGGLRPPGYGDVAVLTRTRDYGRALLATADEYGLPVAYEGGIELFHTDEAKLLLAWLRILEYDGDRGWAVVLERAGYLLDEIDAILDPDHDAAYPAATVAFRDELAATASLGGLARRVFERYGLAGPTADRMLTAVRSARDVTTTTRGDLIRLLERGIERDATHEIDTGTGTEAVTVRTVHATKGLEHPIVILANMNQGAFPPHGGGRATIRYDDPIGLRQRRTYDAEAYDRPHVLDDWRTAILSRCLAPDYDEERRLLYVAITRAKRHLVLAAGERPNAFLESLPVAVETLEPDVDAVAPPETAPSPPATEVVPSDGPTGHTPHSLMRTEPFEDVEGGMGTAFGAAVHEFAEAYALGESVEPSNEDEAHVAAFLDGLDGECRVEEEVTLPLTVDGRRVTVSGVVDLVHVTPDRAEVIDYKTDRGRYGVPEYRTQLSVYHHVASAAYPDRTVTATLLYTERGERVAVEPLSEAELRAVVRDRERAD